MVSHEDGLVGCRDPVNPYTACQWMSATEPEVLIRPILQVENWQAVVSSFCFFPHTFTVQGLSITVIGAPCDTIWEVNSFTPDRSTLEVLMPFSFTFSEAKFKVYISHPSKRRIWISQITLFWWEQNGWASWADLSSMGLGGVWHEHGRAAFLCRLSTHWGQRGFFKEEKGQ